MPFKIVFVSDTFHHHQKGVADALYELTGESYRFIATMPMREERRKMGFDNKYPEYVIDVSNSSEKEWSVAQKIIDEAEVVVLGSAPLKLLRNRLAANRITFRYSERLWKRYKHYAKTPIYMLDNFRTRRCLMLCASAFAAQDYNRLGAFKGRCYKWGYFPEISLEVKSLDNSPIRIMWCARFLDWKHPEIPIYLAKELKEKGYSFIIEMYGDGCYRERSQKLVEELCLGDCVFFKGNVPNTQILKTMQNSDLFLFTSDRGEGWGVVANEAMGSGCVLVASDGIGSIPYLVKNGENGCTFHSPSRLSGFNGLGVSVDRHSLSSLTENVEILINNPDERKSMAGKAIKTIQEIWNPYSAAHNLLSLIDDINHGRDTSIAYGPCSKA